MSTYLPLSCDLLEHLKQISRSLKECRLTYINQDGQFISREGQIVDIYEARGRDCCQLSDGSIICLDRIEVIEY